MNIPTDIIEAQNEIMQLRAQLAETEEKLKEAEARESELHKWARARIDEADAKAFALQAYVEKLTRYLDGIGHACGMGNLQAVELLIAEALRTRPDLPLIEEVREVLENVRGFEVIGERCRKRIDSILARLNPAKL